AAGIALASLAGTPASALTIIGDPELSDDLATPAVPGGPIVPARERGFTFIKTGKQTSCDAVSYRLRFELKGNPELFAHPTFATLVESLRMDFTDQLPAGLGISHFAVKGDVVGAGGGAVPAAVISSTTGPDDTVSLSDFR